MTSSLIIPSVYFTVLKNVFDDTIIETFYKLNIAQVLKVDRKPHKRNKKLDEAIVHFKTSLFVCPEFFHNLSLGIINTVYYNETQYWLIHLNKHKHKVPKLLINHIYNNKQDKVEYYDDKLQIKDMAIRDLEDLCDKLNEEIKKQDNTIIDLKELLNVSAPDLLKVYEDTNAL
jgi:hypothetical protein